ncbi:nuclear protein 96-domain-containing protein [Chytridium lagenaria]|nr:nuclear protein 96-domain-containing protein [Chytridium lagenaria]
MFGFNTNTFGGNQQQQQQQPNNMFGGGGAPTAGGFGAPNPGGFGAANTGFGQPQPAAGGMGGFGAATSGFGATGGFGAAPSAFGAPRPSGFGATTGTGLFGASAQTPASSFGGFGASTAPSTFGGTSSGLFGGGASSGGFGAAQPSAFGAAGGFGAPGQTSQNQNCGTGNPAWQPTQDRDGATASNSAITLFHNISAMPNYKNWSQEELRLQDYTMNKKFSSTTGPGFGATGVWNYGPTTAQQSSFGALVELPLLPVRLVLPRPAPLIWRSSVSTSRRYVWQYAACGCIIYFGGGNTSTFGAAAAGTPGGFGGFGTNTQTQPSTFGGGAFGSATKTGGFGGSTFGQPATGTSSFGGTGGFGTTGTSLFNNAAKTPTQSSFGGFGTGTTPTQGGFGGTTAFGSAPSTAAQVGSLGGRKVILIRPFIPVNTTFGGGFGQQQQQQPASSGLFPSTTPFGSTQQGGGFGQNTAGLFGQNSGTPGFGSNLGGFGGAQQQQSTMSNGFGGGLGASSFGGGAGLGQSSFGGSMFGGNMGASNMGAGNLNGPSLQASIDKNPYGLNPLFPPDAANGQKSAAGAAAAVSGPQLFTSALAESKKPAMLPHFKMTPKSASKIKLRGFPASPAVREQSPSWSKQESPASDVSIPKGVQNLLKEDADSPLARSFPDSFKPRVKKLILDDAGRPGSPDSFAKTPGTPSTGKAVRFNDIDSDKIRSKVVDVMADTRTRAAASLTASSSGSRQQDERRTSNGKSTSDYVMEPSLEELMQMSDLELSRVSGFTVSREGIGKVKFLENVNLLQASPTSTLIEVYPNEDDKDPVGTGLNVPAEVQLEQCWARDRKTGEVIEDDSDPHRYGLDDSDDEDGEEEGGGEDEEYYEEDYDEDDTFSSEDMVPNDSFAHVRSRVPVSAAVKDLRRGSSPLQIALAMPTEKFDSPAKANPTTPWLRASLFDSDFVEGKHVMKTSTPIIFNFAPQDVSRSGLSAMDVEVQPKAPIFVDQPIVPAIVGGGCDGCGLSNARSFRVGWGPSGVIATAGRFAGPQSFSAVKLEQLNFVDLKLGPRKKFEGKALVEQEKHRIGLEILLTNCKISTESEDLNENMANENVSDLLIPSVSVEPTLNFHHFYDMSRKLNSSTRSRAVSLAGEVEASNEESIWKLASALWDPMYYYIDAVALIPELGETRMEKMFQGLRVEEISLWLKEVLGGKEEAPQPPATDPEHARLAEIFLLLKLPTRFSDFSNWGPCAAVGVVNANRMHSNSLGSAAGHGCQSRSFSSEMALEDIHSQLTVWKNQLPPNTLPEPVEKIWSLLGGDVGSWTDQILAPFKDWRQIWALILWYGQGGVYGVSTALDVYDDMWRSSNKVAAPLPTYIRQTNQSNSDIRSYDICYNLLKLFSDPTFLLENAIQPTSVTKSLLDYRITWMFWVILAKAKKVCDFSDVRPSLAMESYMQTDAAGFGSLTADECTASFCLCLESLGLWEWACFSALFLSKPESRESKIKMLLSQHYPLEDRSGSVLQTIQYEGTTNSSKKSSWHYNFLTTALKIPCEWINEAKALRAKYQGSLWNEAISLIDCGQYAGAHDILLYDIVPKYIFQKRSSLIHALLAHLSQFEIYGWSYGGGIVLDFMECSETVSKLLTNLNPSGFGADDPFAQTSTNAPLLELQRKWLPRLQNLMVNLTILSERKNGGAFSDDKILADFRACVLEMINRVKGMGADLLSLGLDEAGGLLAGTFGTQRIQADIDMYLGR